MFSFILPDRQKKDGPEGGGNLHLGNTVLFPTDFTAYQIGYGGTDQYAESIREEIVPISRTCSGAGAL